MSEESKLEPVYIGNGIRIMAHKKKFCTAPCPIHAPSDHHMVSWPLNWRQDRSIFERVCEHGVGHPDPDTLSYIEKTHGKELADSETIHGCDGCCVKKTEAEEDAELAVEYNKGM